MNIKHINERNGRKVFTWCKKKYGKSNYHSTYPKFNYSELPPYDPVILENNTDRGEYFEENNKIAVYGKNHSTFIDFVRTIIHEYTHYLQDDRMYQRYSRKHKKSYNCHPYEIRADEISVRDCRECFKDVFSKNKKK